MLLKYEIVFVAFLNHFVDIGKGPDHILTTCVGTDSMKMAPEKVRKTINKRFSIK